MIWGGVSGEERNSDVQGGAEDLGCTPNTHTRLGEAWAAAQNSSKVGAEPSSARSAVTVGWVSPLGVSDRGWVSPLGVTGLWVHWAVEDLRNGGGTMHVSVFGGCVILISTSMKVNGCFTGRGNAPPCWAVSLSTQRLPIGAISSREPTSPPAPARLPSLSPAAPQPSASASSL